MKINKLLLFIVTALFVSLIVFAACGGSAPTPATSPTKPATSPASTPSPTKPATSPTRTAVPASIPHTLEGRTDCLLCHQTGIGDAEPIPADHAGRTSADCTLCHKPSQ